MSEEKPNLRRSLERAVGMIEDLEARLAAAEEPIAIVGMGCRFPGGASDPVAFWQLMAEGRDAIREVPAERWDIDAFYDPDPDAPGRMSTRSGGFLDEVDRFDPGFFAISPREARSLDPQQRLLLEVCWETLEQGGITAGSLGGSNTGVFVGIGSSNYADRAMQPRNLDAYAGTGSHLSVAAGRISYILGLQGPCLAVNTACSSSLVAIHLACQSLRRRESDLALAGGVALMLDPQVTVYFSKLKALAPDGRCKTFDASADGYGRSEGCGIVALKRLSAARAEGNRILAVVRGTAINHDGRSHGLTAPNGRAQEALIRRALEQAGVGAADIHYVECHGTGTPLGDPIEVEALGRVLGEGRGKGAPVLLGSVKANIGHAESAAGIAGLLKVVLALQNEELPANLHFERPNPHIAWSKLPVAVVTKATPWRRGERSRLAGVSSFGFSGTNAHVIVEEAPAVEEPASNEVERPWHVLALSGRSEKALDAQVSRYARYLGEYRELALADVCHTAGAGRTHFEHRLGIVARTRERLIADLEAVARGELPKSVVRGRASSGPARIVFLFPGQGSQYAGMGRSLFETQPVFRRALERCAAALDPMLERPLLSILYPEEGESSPLDATELAQPAIFAIAIALADLWRSWGIVPDLVVGQSQGEIAAACVAGALSLEDGARVVCRRSRLLLRVSGHGAMVAIGLSEPEVLERLARHGDRVSVAAINSPSATVVSGDAAAIAELLSELEREGVFCRRVSVDYASHGRQMDALREEILASLAGIAPRAGSVTFHSTVTCAKLSGEELGPEYWVRNLREPVQFASVMSQLMEEGYRHFVELSAHPVLAAALSSYVDPSSGVYVPSLRKDQAEWETILRSAGELYAHGAELDWKGFDGPYRRTRVTLPTYPFERERYWLERRPAGTTRGPVLHPLLGRRLPLAGDVNVFETELATDDFPYLNDHRVFGQVVVPATVLIEMARAAAEAVLGEGEHALEGVVIPRALVLPDQGTRTVQVHVAPVEEDDARAEVTIYSRDQGAQESYTAHATGSVVHGGGAGEPGATDLSALTGRCAKRQDLADFYEACELAGISYGPSFQGLADLGSGGDEALARLVLPAPAGDPEPYHVHPALLDAALQALTATRGPAPHGETNEAFLPFEIESFWCRRARGQLFAHARRTAPAERGADVIGGEVTLLDATGSVVGRIRLRCKRAEPAALLSGAAVDRLLFAVDWKPSSRAELSSAGGEGRWLLWGNGPLRSRLGARLAEKGVALGIDDEQITRTLMAVEGVVCFFDEAVPANASPADEAQQRSVQALEIVKALVRASGGRAVRLLLVTRGAYAAPGTGQLALASSPLVGLARVVAQEHPELGTTLVDLDPDNAVSASDVERLVAELGIRGEPEIAYRGEARLVPRLMHEAKVGRGSLPTAPALIRANASYLITGGLGALGLHVAQWLVERGARRLVLMGRRGLVEDARAAIAKLESAGATVVVASGDVGSRRDLEAVLAAIPPDAPLRGVIHSALVLDDGVLLEQTAARFARVMAPKIQGAWNLHELTKSLSIDLFVLFSSQAALFGAAGQSNYAAANAFLDALAEHRRACGLAGLSIAWGAWAGGGALARLDGVHRRKLERNALTPGEGLALLERALARGRAHVGAFRLDGAVRRAESGESWPPPLVRDLVGTRPRKGEGGEMGLAAQLQTLAPEERQAALRSALQVEAAKVLGLRAPSDISPVRPLKELGLDSLMAIELRNRVAKRIGQSLPATFAFENPTIEAQARFVAEHLGQELCHALRAKTRRTSKGLDYSVRLPRDSRSRGGLLVVGIHGVGLIQAETFLATLASKSWLDEAILACPKAPNVERAWTLSALDRMVELVRELKAEYHPARTVVFGFSLGARLAALLALASGDAVQAAILHSTIPVDLSGSGSSFADQARKIAWYAIHATADERAFVENSRTLVALLGRAGVPHVAYEELQGGEHTLNDDAMRRAFAWLDETVRD